MPAMVEKIVCKGERKVIYLSNQELEVDFIFFATGSEPNVELAKKAGIQIGETGAIAVNQYLQTNDPDIYAIGDCMENWDTVTGSKRRHLKKSDWQYLVDTLLFICIVGIAFIGILMGLALPKGPQALESSKYFLGLHRHQWGNIHFYLSIAFVCLVVIHLILSWSWIKGKASRIFHRRWKTMLFLTAALSLLVLVFLWAFYPRTPGAYEDYGAGAGRQAKAEASEGNLYSHEERIFIGEGQGYIVITGQMTLLDIESKTGISARSIADELNLPSGIPLNVTLGRLRRQYLFTMQKVRDAVAYLMKKK
jgi:hypothetical protein